MASVAEILLEKGRQQADARRRQGEITANMYGNLANIISQTGQGIVRAKQNADELALNKQVRDAQIAENTAQTAALNRQAADQQAMDAAGAVAGSDRAAFLAKLPGHLRPQVEKQYAEVDRLADDAKAARVKAEEAESDYFGGLAAQVKSYLSGPDGGLGAAKLAIAHAREKGHDVSQVEAMLGDDPTRLPMILDGLINASPTYRKLAGEESDRALKRDAEARAAEAARQAAADKTADNVRADAALAETRRHNTASEAQAAAAATAARDANLVQVMENGVPVWRPRSQAAGQPAAQAPRAVTGQERQTLAFYNRAKDAVDTLTTGGDKSLETRMASQSLAGQFQLSKAPNVLQTTEQQQYRQAQRAFTEARLRKESGAAIPNSEYENDARTYFAQPGDDKKTIEQKRQARQTVLDGLKFSAGKAYEEYYGEPNVSPARGGGAKADPLGVR